MGGTQPVRTRTLADLLGQGFANADLVGYADRIAIDDNAARILTNLGLLL